MSMFRRIDSLLHGKTSDQLAREVTVRERERTQQDQPTERPTPSHARFPETAAGDSDNALAEVGRVILRITVERASSATTSRKVRDDPSPGRG